MPNCDSTASLKCTLLVCLNYFAIAFRSVSHFTKRQEQRAIQTPLPESKKEQGKLLSLGTVSKAPTRGQTAYVNRKEFPLITYDMLRKEKQYVELYLMRQLSELAVELAESTIMQAVLRQRSRHQFLTGYIHIRLGSSFNSWLWKIATFHCWSAHCWTEENRRSLIFIVLRHFADIAKQPARVGCGSRCQDHPSNRCASKTP